MGGRNSPFFVEKFEGVPLTGVVTGRDDHTTAGTFHRNGQFGRRRGSQTDVDHVEAHAHQRTADDLADHLTGDARIATDYDLATIFAVHHFFAQAGEGGHRFSNIYGVECVPAAATDRAAESRIDLIKVILLFILLIALGANLSVTTSEQNRPYFDSTKIHTSYHSRVHARTLFRQSSPPSRNAHHKTQGRKEKSAPTHSGDGAR